MQMARCSDDLRADWLRTDIREVLDNVGMMVSAVSVPDYRHVYLNKELLDAMRRAGIGDCDSLIGKRPWDVFPGWKEAFLSTYEEANVRWIQLDEALADPVYQREPDPPRSWRAELPVQMIRARQLQGFPLPASPAPLLERLCRQGSDRADRPHLKYVIIL
jgi:hypothetical protein